MTGENCTLCRHPVHAQGVCPGGADHAEPYACACPVIVGNADRSQLAALGRVVFSGPRSPVADSATTAAIALLGQGLLAFGVPAPLVPLVAGLVRDRLPGLIDDAMAVRVTAPAVVVEGLPLVNGEANSLDLLT